MPSKTIFITGTNSGFGKAAVEQFAQAGWQVVATVRDLSAHSQLFKEFTNVEHGMDFAQHLGLNAVLHGT